MASRELRPKIRLGKSNPMRVKAAFWAIGLLAGGGGIYAAYHYAATTEVEVPVSRVRRGDFTMTVKTRGEIKSARSLSIRAPQVPSLTIQKLATNGAAVNKGDVVVEFDSVTQEQNVLTRTVAVQTAEGQVTQTKASQRITNETNALNKTKSEFALEQAKLEASKAEVLSDVLGQQNRISVGTAEGALQQVKAAINATQVGNEAEMVRYNQTVTSQKKNLELTKSYLTKMKLYAPIDGVVSINSNFRATGSYGSTPPPYKEGDSVFTNAEIAQIPDLSEMYIDLKLDEVDRGKLKIGQSVQVRVDAIPDREFTAELDYISPVAALTFSGGAGASASGGGQSAQKSFPARATLKILDPRLRPGMSGTATITTKRVPNALLIPARANFDDHGKPAAFLQSGKAFASRHIQIGDRNEDDVIVTGGLKEGDIVALEDPVELAKKAKKKI
jgi:HlyD family secretion protein